jgi:hypothetical protein
MVPIPLNRFLTAPATTPAHDRLGMRRHRAQRTARDVKEKVRPNGVRAAIAYRRYLAVDDAETPRGQK